MERLSDADVLRVHRFVEVAVSLQGTLETFALPDVLVLLSSTKKSGELKVVGARGEGRVWVDKGQIIYSENNAKECAPVDAVFELLRLESGTFAFVADTTPPKKGEPQIVDLVLSEAQGRLTEWRDIEKVVPHLDAVIDMAPNAPGDEVTVSDAQWKMLVAVAGGRDIHTLMDRLSRSEFDTCKSVKELVEAGMATIDANGKARKEAASAAKAESNAGDKTATESAKAEDEASKADQKPESAGKAGNADNAEKTGKADKGDDESSDTDNLARARRVRATIASDSDEAKPEPARVSARRDGDSAPLPSVPANGNGNGNAKSKVDGKVEAKLDALPSDHREEDTEALVAQLAALGVDEDDPEAKEKIAARLAEEAEATGEEPINRGLLLKFLSSVRN